MSIHTNTVVSHINCTTGIDLWPCNTIPEKKTTISRITHKICIDYLEWTVELARIIIKNVTLGSYKNWNIQIMCMSVTITISHEMYFVLPFAIHQPCRLFLTTAKHKLTHRTVQLMRSCQRFTQPFPSLVYRTRRNEHGREKFKPVHTKCSVLTVCTTCFNVQQLCILSRVFMGFVWFSK